jgi:5'-nucleotidase
VPIRWNNTNRHILITVCLLFALQPACAQQEPVQAAALREIAARRLIWRAESSPTSVAARVQILARNDFHGALNDGMRIGARPAGGAAVLAAYLKAEQRGWESATIIAHAGDHVGASPAVSALLQDEPAIALLNQLGNSHCSYQQPWDARCNVIGTLGNHEFDEGRVELLRLIYGGTHERGPYLEQPYQGAKFAYVSANVLDVSTAEYLLPPFAIKQVGAVRIGFIGALLRQTPAVVPAAAIAGLQFLDEARAINRQVAVLKAQGVRAIVVLLHQGGFQSRSALDAQPAPLIEGADINDIIRALDDEVDLVISGHSHSYTNARVPNANGKPILVTQAFFSGTAYADIELEIDERSGDVVATSSAIVTTYADAGPGLEPDAQAAALVARAQARVDAIVKQVVASAAQDIPNAVMENGESPMGQLIADAQRAAVGADIALMNPGGIRWGLSAGPVTWGDIFTVHPFGNRIVHVELSGANVLALLNQQWRGTYPGRLLAVSGITYAWDAVREAGERVVAVRIGADALDTARTYTVAVNDFMLGGGDGFAQLKRGANPAAGPLDRDALIAYLRALPQPVRVVPMQRIRRIN